MVVMMIVDTIATWWPGARILNALLHTAALYYGEMSYLKHP